MAIKLGKTRDSRTRKQQVKAVNVTAQENLLQELKDQKEFVEYLLLKGYSLSTIERYVKDSIKFTQWSAQENIPIEQVSYSDVLYYIQNKRGKIKQASISKTVNSIKHYYNYLQLKEIVKDNPTQQIQIKGIKRKILYNVLSKQELESLFNNFEIPTEESKNKNQNWYASSILTKKRNKVMLGLMIYQGLNGQELGNLKEADLKLREGKIYIAGTRKSNERTLKLEAHQVLDMMEYTLQVRPQLVTLNKKTSLMLFTNSQGGSSFHNVIAYLIKYLKKQNSKIQNVQQIRTSVITHWLKQYNLREVQYRAGHRYVSSTEAYLVNDLDGLQEDIAKFHPIG
jgi:integrase/recombinase XerD